MFNLLQIEADSSSRRSTADKKLRQSMLLAPSEVKEENAFYVKYPAEEEHANHIVGEVRKQMIFYFPFMISVLATHG